MPGFDALYKQTVTLFNRITLATDEVVWRPTVLNGVHLIVNKASSWNSYGGSNTDTVTLNVRYLVKDGEAYISGKKYYEPKAFRRLGYPEDGITFCFGNNDDADFFIEGVYGDGEDIHDDAFERKGFYNYINKKYDNVFVVKSASKFNLIPHFEITAG